MRGRSLSMVLSMWCLLALCWVGCDQSETPEPTAEPEVIDLTAPAVSEEQAMQIAMQGVDAVRYTATSTIVGPMQYHGIDITAYEVTLREANSVLLRYVNADTGDLMMSEDVQHSLSIPTGSMMAEKATPENYYTSCPSGWPLCINPGSITFYSQNDPNWACQYLGNSTSYTLGNSSQGATCNHAMNSAGCLVSAYAMELNKTGHGANDPSVLNSKKDCFSGANVNGSCMASKFGASYYTISVNQVWSTVASGIPVVAYGNSNCLGSSTHAQMIWGHDGSRYWTKDPWYAWNNQDQPLCLSNVSYRVLR